MNTPLPLDIAGVFLQPLAIIPTPDGAVLHMLKAGSPLLPHFPQGFGEIYFSEVYAGHIKAWKCHKEQTQHFVVPIGLLQFVLCDGREDSPGKGKMVELRLGRPDNYNLLKSPPGVWYGFRSLDEQVSLICNCASIPHDPQESIKLPWDSELIPYNWGNGVFGK